MSGPVVVATDLSDPSERAVREALQLARRFGAEIVLVHVTPLIEPRTGHAWLDPTLTDRYNQELDKELARTREALAGLRQRHLSKGVDISVSLVSGEVDEAIAKAAEDCDAQLIVVGARGRGHFDGLLIGGVAAHVSRFTTRDVLIARNAQPSREFRRVLLATDFSEAASYAFEAALRLAAERATLTIFHSLELVYTSRQLVEELSQAAKAHAEELASQARARGLVVELEISQAHPGSAISELSATSELVVIGSHGRRGFRRFVMGSLAEQAVRHATCSVYIARRSRASN